jgi:hypothetical protein
MEVTWNGESRWMAEVVESTSGQSTFEPIIQHLLVQPGQQATILPTSIHHDFDLIPILFFLLYPLSSSLSPSCSVTFPALSHHHKITNRFLVSLGECFMPCYLPVLDSKCLLRRFWTSVPVSSLANSPG